MEFCEHAGSGVHARAPEARHRFCGLLSGCLLLGHQDRHVATRNLHRYDSPPVLRHLSDPATNCTASLHTATKETQQQRFHLLVPLLLILGACLLALTHWQVSGQCVSQISECMSSRSTGFGMPIACAAAMYNVVHSPSTCLLQLRGKISQNCAQSRRMHAQQCCMLVCID